MQKKRNKNIRFSVYIIKTHLLKSKKTIPAVYAYGVAFYVFIKNIL